MQQWQKKVHKYSKYFIALKLILTVYYFNHLQIKQKTCPSKLLNFFDLRPLNTSKQAINPNPPFFWDTLYIKPKSCNKYQNFYLKTVESIQNIHLVGIDNLILFQFKLEVAVYISIQVVTNNRIGKCEGKVQSPTTTYIFMQAWQQRSRLWWQCSPWKHSTLWSIWEVSNFEEELFRLRSLDVSSSKSHDSSTEILCG